MTRKNPGDGLRDKRAKPRTPGLCSNPQRKAGRYAGMPAAALPPQSQAVTGPNPPCACGRACGRLLPSSRLHVDGGALEPRDAIHGAVYVRSLALPRVEHGVDGQAQLLVGVLGEGLMGGREGRRGDEEG